MKTTKDADLCLTALQRSDLGPRIIFVREEAEYIAHRRHAKWQMPLVLQEVDLLVAALAFPRGEEFVESYLHPHPQPNPSQPTQ